MDPHTGRVYNNQEIQALPKEIQDRLVPVRTPYSNSIPSDLKPKTVRRREKQKNAAKFDADLTKRRAKNKVARKSRRKNRH